MFHKVKPSPMSQLSNSSTLPPIIKLTNRNLRSRLVIKPGNVYSRNWTIQEPRAKHSSSLINSNNYQSIKTNTINSNINIVNNANNPHKYHFSQQIALDPNLIENSINHRSENETKYQRFDQKEEEIDEYNQTISNVPNTDISIYLNMRQNSKKYIPQYLESTYWWAYTHPRAVEFWERQWLVDAILWGNFNYLRDIAINEVKSIKNRLINNGDNKINILQVAAVYGNFSSNLCKCLLNDSNDKSIEHTLEIVDIAPVQLENTEKKLKSQLSNMVNTGEIESNNNNNLNIILTQNDSSNMISVKKNDKLLSKSNTGAISNDKKYDMIYCFFLLHEQPYDVRIGTISECMRLLNNNGKLVFVDYHKPKNLHPLLPIMKIILTNLEPFAMDLWNYDISGWIDNKIYKRVDVGEDNSEDGKELYTLEKDTYFGGLYQKVVIEKV